MPHNTQHTAHSTTTHSTVQGIHDTQYDSEHTSHANLLQRRQEAEGGGIQRLGIGFWPSPSNGRYKGEPQRRQQDPSHLPPPISPRVPRVTSVPPNILVRFSCSSEKNLHGRSGMSGDPVPILTRLRQAAGQSLWLECCVQHWAT